MPMTACTGAPITLVGGIVPASKDSKSIRLMIQLVYVSTAHAISQVQRPAYSPIIVEPP